MSDRGDDIQVFALTDDGDRAAEAPASSVDRPPRRARDPLLVLVALALVVLAGATVVTAVSSVQQARAVTRSACVQEAQAETFGPSFQGTTGEEVEDRVGAYRRALRECGVDVAEPPESDGESTREGERPFEDPQADELR